VGFKLILLRFMRGWQFFVLAAQALVVVQAQCQWKAGSANHYYVSTNPIQLNPLANDATGCQATCCSSNDCVYVNYRPALNPQPCEFFSATGITEVACGTEQGCENFSKDVSAPTNAPPTNAAPTNAAPTNAPPTNAPPTNAAPTNGPLDWTVTVDVTVDGTNDLESKKNNLTDTFKKEFDYTAAVSISGRTVSFKVTELDMAGAEKLKKSIDGLSENFEKSLSPVLDGASVNVQPAQVEEDVCSEAKLAITDTSKIKKVCGEARKAFEQYAPMEDPICIVLNDAHVSVFYPRVDDFNLLQLYDSYNEAWYDQPPAANKTRTSCVRVEMGGVTSTYKRRNSGSLIVPFWTISAVLKDGKVSKLEWDDGCAACQQQDDNPDGQCIDSSDCAIPRSTCSKEAGKTNCDFKLYFGWFGTDVNGRYLTSASRRISQFRQYSIAGAYKSAKASTQDTIDWAKKQVGA